MLRLAREPSKVLAIVVASWVRRLGRGGIGARAHPPPRAAESRPPRTSTHQKQTHHQCVSQESGAARGESWCASCRSLCCLVASERSYLLELVVRATTLMATTMMAMMKTLVQVRQESARRQRWSCVLAAECVVVCERMTPPVVRLGAGVGCGAQVPPTRQPRRASSTARAMLQQRDCGWPFSREIW